MNTLITTFTGANSFNPASMICQDDCAQVNPALTCNAQCICQKPPAVNCAANTNNVKAGQPNTFNKATMQCKDDCATIDPTLSCDANTCTCQKTPPPSCAANSIGVALAGGKNSYNPFGGQICKDDCALLDPTLVCNALTCTCKKNTTIVNDTLECATNTIFAEDSAGGSIFNSSYRCEDNCKQLDPSLSCDPNTCTCKKIVENQSVSCAANTRPSTSTLEKLGPGLLCKDDCVSNYGSNYYCEALSCQCIEKSRQPTFSCLDNSLSSLWGLGPSTPLPSSYLCQDDCNETGFYCDSSSCVCKPEVNVTQGTTSCALNTYDSIYSGNNSYAAGAICKDDCKTLGENYKCDSSSCTCEPITPPQNVSCAGNTNPESGSTVEKLGPGLICKDDCAEQMGSGYSCDAGSCTCQKTPKNTTISCAESSFETALTGSKAGPVPSGYICKDDCAELDPNFVCDANTCVCKPSITVEPGSTSCAVNSYEALYSGGENGFNASTSICKDDCKQIDPSYVCDGSSCTCKPPITENTTVSCSSNTNPDATTVEKLGAGMICKDDCSSGYTCDASSCTCKPSSVTTQPVIYCAGNSFSSQLSEGGNEYDARVMICEDNCKILGPGYECDKSSCTCMPPPPETVSCSSNSFGVGNYGTALKPFDASSMICEDDCAQLSSMAGVSLECDPKTCACKPSAQLSCSQNTYVFDTSQGSQTLTSGSAKECKDDCATIEPGSTCDPKTCMCNYSDYNISASCAARTYGTTLEALPKNAVCKDDCSSLGAGYTCDSYCQCEAPINETQTHGVCDYQHGICEMVQGSGTSECATDTDCVPPTNEHTECVEHSCLLVPGYGSDQCLTDADCGKPVTENITQYHNVCSGTSCITELGAGTDQCQSDLDCSQPVTENVTQYHNVCEGTACTTVEGAGTDQCTSDLECQPQTHTECDYTHQACITVQGPGTSTCASDTDCEPPKVDCPSYCSGQGFSQSLGSSYTSSDQCKAAAAESAVQCTTTCIYTSFYQATNPAGTTTCCCKARYTYSCSDCPGANPMCPQCPASKPS